MPGVRSEILDFGLDHSMPREKGMLVMPQTKVEPLQAVGAPSLPELAFGRHHLLP